METPDHQEKRARQRINMPAVVKAAGISGLIFFIMSGGGPWSTAGTMNAIMGRDVQLPMIALIIGHFLLALIYVFIIARVIYRFRVVTGIAIGFLVTMVLYGVNFGIFRGLGMVQQSPEFRTFLVHAIFGVMASAIYKAMAVPRPLRGNAAGATA